MPMMIGITGHQDRDGINWNWVRKEIKKAICDVHGDIVGMSSLAVGSDQVFARCVLECGGRLIAVIPTAHYEGTFSRPEELEEYEALIARSEIIQLVPDRNDNKSFLNAGIWIVDHADYMLAVWDGQPAEGLGGTADVVGYAQKSGRAILHLDPITSIVRSIVANTPL